MKVFVTGAAGFIGSCLCRNLLRDEVDVVGLDNLSWGNRKSVPDDCRFIEANILQATESVKIRAAARGADAIIHCAANIEITRAIQSVEYDIENNTLGTIRVGRLAEALGIPLVLNFSSACVYGHEMEPCSCREAEVARLSPNWPYGASKIAAEAYLNMMANNGAFCAVHFRPTIVSGPGEWYGRALTIFVHRAIRQQPLVVFVDPPSDDGKPEAVCPVRDVVHIDDVVAATRAVLRRSASAGLPQPVCTLNLGSGHTYSILEMAEKVAEICPVEIRKEPVAPGARSSIVKEAYSDPASPGRLRLPDELKKIQVDTSFTSCLLGLDSYRTLDAVVRDLVAWVRSLGAAGMDKWVGRGMKY